jgi:hypothetical protein
MSFNYGDYVLSNANKHYCVPDQVWRCKTKEEKEKIFTNFMRDNRKKITAIYTLRIVVGP